MAAKNFWFKFVPADWRKDPDLSRCSLAAKGFWIDAICILQEAEEPGVFRSNGIPWQDQEIVAAVGVERELGLSCLSELLTKGVCSRSKDGAVFARRVVRDHQLKKVRSEAGKLGGNPNFKRESELSKQNNSQNGLLKQTDKQIPSKRLSKIASKPSNSNYKETTTESYEHSDSELISEEKKVNGSALASTRASRQAVFDEPFQEFRSLCSKAGEHGCLIGGDADSWNHAWYAWATLDMEQKLSAVAWIRKRIEVGNWDDSILKSLPSTVLAKKNWNRPISKPTSEGRRSFGDERLRNA